MNSAVPDTMVSVVMVFWNAEAYMDEAVQSVLAQTQPIELLLCDDGSTDGSTAIAQRWVDREPDRVRYLSHPDGTNRGMSATRNLGIGAARGEYVAFLDADDVWEPDHLATDAAYLRRHPGADFVCGRAMEWHSWRASAQPDEWTPLAWPPGTLVPPPRMLTATLRHGSYRTPTCSLLVRKTFLNRVGGAEDSFTSMFEDQVLLAKLHLSGTSIVSGARSARYRRHQGSSTVRAQETGTYHPSEPNPSYEAFVRWLDTHAHTYAAGTDADFRAALRAALTPYDQPRIGLARSVRQKATHAVSPSVRRVAAEGGRRMRAIARARSGVMGRRRPLSREFGFDRGLPIDRHYIEQFLAENAHLIAGRVLEVGDASYTRRFGGHQVTRADVLNVTSDRPGTTFVADLASGDGLPSDAFDCVVLTQTLHLIYDLPVAVRTLRRILRPGGTVLATFPGISPLSNDRWAETWHWSLTPTSAARLFGDAFGEANVDVASRGNVLTSAAFLYGMAAHELSSGDLLESDPQFPMLITTRAFRPASAPGGTT